jgi:hypothetical protein
VCISLHDQPVILLPLRLQPRGLVLSSFPRLGKLLQLSLQHRIGVAGILQRFVQLGRRIGFGSLQRLVVVKAKLDKLVLELLGSGSLGAQLFLMLLDKLVLLLWNPKKKMLTKLYW